MGELRVDARQPNKTDAGAAVEAYRRGVGLRRQIAGRSDATPGDRRDLALSLAKLGNGEFLAGDPKQAAASYQSARGMAQSLVRSEPHDLSMARALGTADERLCIALLAAGDSAGAMESCREGIETLAPLAQAMPDDVEVHRLIATTEGSYANALRLSGKPQDGAVHARLALESLHRLEALAPSNAEYRRLAASSETILAGSLAASGDIPASLDAFSRSIQSMEIAIEIDPSDLGSPLRLAGTLLAFSRRLAQGPQKERAHDSAREALRLLQQTAEKPGAGAVEWNEYADALLKVDWPDLQSPAKALQLAGNAVSSTKRTNPFFLDTLAWAYFRNGNAPKAADTEREALRLLPDDAKGGLHDELARGLESFLKGGQ
jgi:tetratricopeptide (TPR) repeat protein